MSRLVTLARPILVSYLSSCRTKRLVCDLIDMYVKTTDNDVDDFLAKTVRTALMRDCK